MKSTKDLPYATGHTLFKIETAVANAGKHGDGLAVQSILPHFFGHTGLPYAIAAIRVWTGGLFDQLDEQQALIDSRALGHLEVPVSVVFGGTDRYLNPSLAAQRAGLLKDPSIHLGKTPHIEHDMASMRWSPNLLRGCENDAMTADAAVSSSRPPLGGATSYFRFWRTLRRNGPLKNRRRRLSSIICTRRYVADELNWRSPDAE
jgi:hypothetical protein